VTYQRDFADRVRVGLVGAGSHAYRNILPALTYLPVTLTAVCDVDLERAQVTAAQYGAPGAYASLEEMLAAEELDAVLLCVSPQLHPQLAITAFRAGVHVWLEKPAGMRSSEVADMIAARGDLVGVIGYKKAFMPATRKVAELLAREDSGPLRSILARYPISVPSDGAGVLERREFSGWLADGCHPLSFMLEIGGPIGAVSTFRGVNGGGACILHFESGVIGNLHLAEGGPRSQPFEQYVCFAGSCSVEVDNALRVIYQRGIPFEYSTTKSFAPPGIDSGAVVWEAQNGLNTLDNIALFTQGVYDELLHFCECVLDGTRPERGSLEFAFAVTAAYEAALLSDGEPVDVAGAVRA
jgi:predicted dehydrogenase